MQDVMLDNGFPLFAYRGPVRDGGSGLKNVSELFYSLRNVGCSNTINIILYTLVIESSEGVGWEGRF